MIINIYRLYKKEKYTIGKMFTDGAYVCDTLELPINKAIPTGNYLCKIRHSPKFQRDVVEILNVPGRTDILFHSGNSVKDTAGCVLLGRNNVVGGLTESRKAEDKFMQLAKNAIAQKDELICVIK